MNSHIVRFSVLILILVFFSGFARQIESIADIEKAAQNPLADRIFLGVQSYTNFGLGPYNRVQEILNVQPVIPFDFGNWNLTTRWVIPFVFQPELTSESGRDFGLGDLKTFFFFNVHTARSIRSGFGPVFLIPTATDNSIGADKWALGPAVVVEINSRQWLVGLRVDNLWTFAGDDDREDLNILTMQPFINFVVPGTDGLLLTSTPVITANWETSTNRWTVPLGGGAGYLIRVKEFSFLGTVQGFWNALRGELSPDWTMQITLQAIFPKKRQPD
ncbi:MAG: neuromedin U [Fibrobacter sp.]|jgi:hypothetical protein|nr:neuromedin U [Fibrobacter sp.]